MSASISQLSPDRSPCWPPSGTALLGALVKQRLLAAVATAVGMAGSAGSGAVHDLAVRVASPHGH